MPVKDLNKLKRKQIDELIRPYAAVPLHRPKGGWLRTVRTALGMTMEQVGARMGRPKQGVKQLEQSEAKDSITMANLRAAADAMDCDLIVALRPRAGSIEEAIRRQALRKAQGVHSNVLHTMALEAQTEGLDENPDLSADVEWWLAQNPRRLWD
jgi:predicted DNA-binding mobile mystery protein A